MERILCLVVVCVVLGLSQGHSVGERVKRQDNSRALIVTTILEPPFMMLKNDSGLEGNDRFEGYIADLLKLIMEEAGLEYEVFPVYDGRYGYQDPDTDEWHGMIGELMKRQADLAAAPLTRTPKREEVVDFTYPIMSVKMTALVNRDVEAETLQDLIDNEDISFGVVEGGSTENALRSSTAPQMQALWARISPDTGYLKSQKDGAEQAREGNFASICEKPFGDYLAAQPPCNLRTTRAFTIPADDVTPGEPASYNFAFRKSEDLRNTSARVSEIIEGLEEDGTLARMYKERFIQGGVCAGCAVTASLALLVASITAMFTLLH